jgi:hypothetical protein
MILDISHVFFAWLKLSDCTPEKAREYLKIHWPRSNAAGWLMGLLAGLLIYFRKHHILRETDVRPPQLAASSIPDAASGADASALSIMRPLPQFRRTISICRRWSGITLYRLPRCSIGPVAALSSCRCRA